MFSCHSVTVCLFCLWLFLLHSGLKTSPTWTLAMSESFLCADDGSFCVFQGRSTCRPTTNWETVTPACAWPLVSANPNSFKMTPCSIRRSPPGYQRTHCTTSWLSYLQRMNTSVMKVRMDDLIYCMWQLMKSFLSKD